MDQLDEAHPPLPFYRRNIFAIPGLQPRTAQAYNRVTGDQPALELSSPGKRLYNPE